MRAPGILLSYRTARALPQAVLLLPANVDPVVSAGVALLEQGRTVVRNLSLDSGVHRAVCVGQVHCDLLVVELLRLVSDLDALVFLLGVLQLLDELSTSGSPTPNTSVVKK